MVALAGQKAALEQPAGFVAFLGASQVIAVERRRQLLQAAVSRKPGDLGLLMTLGWTYANNDQSVADEGLRWYQAAVAAAPANAAALNALGCVLCDDKRDYDGAIACFRRAIELAPKDAQGHFHYNLGNALRGKGQWDEAIACWRKAIALDPKYAEAHCNLGQALRSQGRFAEALASLQRGHELGSKRPGWPYPSAQWVRQARPLAALEAKLPAVL